MQTVNFQTLTKDDVIEIVEGIIAEKLHMKEDRQMTTKEVCEMFHVSIITLSNWRKSNKIPYSKIGRRVLFRLSDVEKLLQEKRYE